MEKRLLTLFLDPLKLRNFLISVKNAATVDAYGYVIRPRVGCVVLAPPYLEYRISAWASSLLVLLRWAMRRPQRVGRVTSTIPTLSVFNLILPKLEGVNRSASLMQTILQCLWHELFIFMPLLILLIPVALKLRKIHDVSELHPFDVAHTMPLRGILALIIVAHHMQLYFPTLHDNVFNHVGGSCVAIFFFISGYGLMKSYMRKGDGYLQGFLQKRFGRILPLLFCLSVVNIALRMWINQETLWYILSGFPKQYTLRFSWFMYTISYFYIVFYFVARRIHSGRALLLGVTIAVLFFICIMFLLPFDLLWYRTVISGVFGLAVAYYEPQIQQWIFKHKVAMFVVLFAVWAIVRVSMHAARATDSALIHMFFAEPILNEPNVVPFIILLVVYTVGMTQNKVLYFMGQISMEIYLFHGLYTQIALWMGITNVWIAALFVYTLSIASAALLWKLQQRHHAQTVKAA